MDINLLKTFIEITRTGSFIKASGKLRLTQTAVTVRMKNLEEMLGYQLLIRNKTGAKLTEHGTRFVSYASQIIQTWESAQRMLRFPEVSTAMLTLGGEVTLWNLMLLSWVDNYQDMREAITFHATNAAQRMRKKGLYTGAVYMSIANGIHDQAEFYHGSQYVSLPSPTNCTIQITQAALWLLDRVYKRGVYYMRASVMLDELVSEGEQQQELFGYSDQDSKSTKLMTALDQINKKYQRGTIKLASEGLQNGWAMRRAFKSPNYTTDWKDLPVVG